MASPISVKGANSQTPSGPPTKIPKRKITLVSPASPPLTATEMKSLLHEQLNPIYDDLHSIRESVASVGEKMKGEIDSLKQSLDEVRQQLTSITSRFEERINNVESENNRLRAKLKEDHSRISALTDRVISLEGHSRRDNLKFLNVRVQNSDHAQENCEAIVHQLCKDLGVTLDDQSIVRAHRTGAKRKGSQPIIVKFHHYKDKLAVLKAKNRFREIGVIVVEDFPIEILERRRMFQPFLQAAYKSKGTYKARLVLDKILINGKLYTTEQIPDLPRGLQPENTSSVNRGNITAFFTSQSPLSNHHPCQFTVENQKFLSVEQFFMYKKAMYFHDMGTAQQVLQSTCPKQAKRLGKAVKNFDLDQWRSVCDTIMRTGLSAKFLANDSLASFLKCTGDQRLVEANPHDKYWGVGLSLQDEDVWNSAHWKGKNVLGKLLEEVRSAL